MANTTGPKLLRVECCKTKKQVRAGEWTLVGSFRAENTSVWQQFEIPRRLDAVNITRRWKVTFVSNFGNTTAVAVNGVQIPVVSKRAAA
ncbi:unnamed protein product [Ectocarpus sp. 4 AP-2014]